MRTHPIAPAALLLASAMLAPAANAQVPATPGSATPSATLPGTTPSDPAGSTADAPTPGDATAPSATMPTTPSNPSDTIDTPRDSATSATGRTRTKPHPH